MISTDTKNVDRYLYTNLDRSIYHRRACTLMATNRDSDHHRVKNKGRSNGRYLADHLTPASDVASRLRLRSANRQQLLVPRCRLDTYGRWAFAIAGPTFWNSLPDELKDPARGSDSFKQFLKTILFSFY